MILQYPIENVMAINWMVLSLIYSVKENEKTLSAFIKRYGLLRAIVKLFTKCALSNGKQIDKDQIK